MANVMAQKQNQAELLRDQLSRMTPTEIAKVLREANPDAVVELRRRDRKVIILSEDALQRAEEEINWREQFLEQSKKRLAGTPADQKSLRPRKPLEERLALARKEVAELETALSFNTRNVQFLPDDIETLRDYVIAKRTGKNVSEPQLHISWEELTSHEEEEEEQKQE